MEGKNRKEKEEGKFKRERQVLFHIYIFGYAASRHTKVFPVSAEIVRCFLMSSYLF